METVTEVPVPLKLTVCGESPALSVIVNVPVRLPADVGVKVTEIVQLAPAATLLPQVLTSAKSPDALMEAMERDAVPEFVSVIVRAALVEPVACASKVKLVGETVAAGAGATPVPLSPTV